MKLEFSCHLDCKLHKQLLCFGNACEADKAKTKNKKKTPQHFK